MKVHKNKINYKGDKQRSGKIEFYFRELIENTPDLVFTLDDHANFIYINKRLKTLLNFLPEEWIGKSFYDLIISEDKAKAQKNFKDVIAGKIRTFEIEVNSQKQEPFFLWININPIYQDGKIIGALAIARDVTERTKLKQEITDLKNFIENIIQSMEAGLIALDSERKITFFNRSAEELLGYKTREVMDKTLEEILPYEESKKLLPEIIPPEYSLYNREMQLTTKTGDKILVGFTVSRVTDDQHKKANPIISFREISKIKEMQLEVLRMDKLASLGTLAFGIVNEVKDYIAGIKANTQMLSEDVDKKDPCQKYLDRIVSQTNQLDKLMEQLIDYAKLRQPNRKFYHLDKIMQQVYLLSGNLLLEKNIKFIKKFDVELPLIYVDFEQMVQVFDHLVLNAFEAMPNGGFLEINARKMDTIIHVGDRRKRRFPMSNRKSTYLEVMITDSGLGINPEEITKIFDPFYTTKYKKAGLGLSIVYRIIEEHEGEIKVDSVLGQGTTVTLLLPTQEQFIK